MTTKKMTNAEIVEAFNKLKTKPYLSVKDLETSKPHKILSMFRYKTKYGNVVVAELEDGNLYLPRRYNNLKDEVLEGAVNGVFVLTKKLNNNDCVLELEEVINENANNGEESFSIPNSQPFFSWEPTKIQRIY